MRARKKLLTCLAVAFAIGATAAPSASAATTIGNACIGDSAEPPLRTMTQLSQVSSSLPLTAPESGVITKWGVSVIPYPGGVSEKLKVLRPTGAPNTFQAVAESGSEAVLGGVNSFSTRLPIEAGDKIGAVGTPATIICVTGSAPGDVLGMVANDLGLNSSAAFTPEAGKQLAVTATIEPDADKDGFGDETQDQCPQHAAVQTSCPTLTLDALAMPAGKDSVRILVAADAAASIRVSASAKVRGKSKKAKAVVTKLASVTQLVSPGKIAGYTLNFNKALKSALGQLPRTKTIKLNVVASGNSLAGALSSKKLTVKLKGRAKPRR